MQNSKIVLCLTTFNRTDCAKINLEIIKLNYKDPWPVVHVCSDKKYKKYIEDVLIQSKPKPLTKGAYDLLKKSIISANSLFKPNFLVHIEADTWLMNQELIKNYISKLENNKKAVIACSRWDFDKTVKWKNSKKIIGKIKFLLGMISKKMGFFAHIGSRQSISTQFFIAKNTSDFRNIFLKIQESELKDANYKDEDYLEHILYKKILNKFGKSSFIWMDERRPVHPKYRNICKELELYCQHYPTKKLSNKFTEDGKKETLEKYSFLKKGPNMLRLLKCKNFDYYNKGAERLKT
jgi:hypothetical protein